MKKSPLQKKGGAAALPGYDLICWIDVLTRRIARVDKKPLKELAVTAYQKQLVHRNAFEETLKRGIYHYEWSRDVGKRPVLFQTTCVLLTDPAGKPSGVLTLSRDITNWADSSLQKNVLKDWAAPQTFSQLLLAAREQEKKAISKALHDEIGSSAVMLTTLLKLVKANVLKGKAQFALRDIAQLDTQLKESIERLKNIIVSLRPPSLENKGGLVGAVRDLLENISTLGHFSYQFKQDELEDKICLSDNVKILLYRIVQESLTNIVKHARAKQVQVSLKQVRGNIRLVVQDDGVGFNVTESRSLRHVGLLAMKDSVELLGGELTIKSAPGEGTRIQVVCPSVVYGGEE